MAQLKFEASDNININPKVLKKLKQEQKKISKLLIKMNKADVPPYRLIKKNDNS